MIRRIITSFIRKKDEPAVYAVVVSDDKERMVEMLRIAVRRANEDQKALISAY